MKGNFGTGQMVAILFSLIVVLGMLMFGIVWVEEKAGWGLAFGLGLMIFVVITLFVQQFLTSQFFTGVQRNLVEYDAAQANVEAKRAAISLENAKMVREGARSQWRIDEAQYKQMMVAAQKMAGYLTDAERAKLEAQMGSYGLLVDKSAGGDEVSLD